MRYVLLALLLIGTVTVFERGAVPCDTVQYQPACYVTMRPGPTRDVFELTSVDGFEAPDGAGELLLTTVSIQDRLGWRSLIGNALDDAVVNLDRELIYPSDVSRDEVDDLNAAAMDTSELDATIAGLEAAGYDLTAAFEGAEVVEVTDDGAVTDDEVRVGDVIVAVDGVPVTTSAEAITEVRRIAPGDELVLTVRRGGDDVDVTLVAAPNPADTSLPYLGLLLSTSIELPVDVEIDAGNIGGPSAGMMFALGIVSLVGEQDLTGGRVVAGTGTITTDGIVGPIGGIQQKVIAASGREDPAELFLVPRANFVEARAAAVSREILIVPIDNLDDAVQALSELRAGESPAEAVALAP